MDFNEDLDEIFDLTERQKSKSRKFKSGRTSDDKFSHGDKSKMEDDGDEDTDIKGRNPNILSDVDSPYGYKGHAGKRKPEKIDRKQARKDKENRQK